MDTELTWENTVVIVQETEHPYIFSRNSKIVTSTSEFEHVAEGHSHPMGDNISKVDEMLLEYFMPISSCIWQAVAKRIRS